MATPGDEFELLYEAASDVLFTTTLSGEVTRVNRSFERVLGLNRLDVVGSNIRDWIAQESWEVFEQAVLERIGGGTPTAIEVDMCGTTGAIPIEVVIELVFTSGTPTGLYGVGRDITDAVRSRLDMAAANETLFRQTEQLATFSRYLKLLHRLSTTAYSTLDELFGEYLRTGCEIFRLSSGAILRATEEGPVTAQLQGSDPTGFLDTLTEKVFRTETTAVGQVAPRAGSRAFFYAGAPITVAESRFGALLFWSEDTTEIRPHAREMVEMMARGMGMAIQQRQLTEELEFQARHDVLTRLPNLKSFQERLEEDITRARMDRTMLGIMFVDLDRFKVINDNWGHAAGDMALFEIGRRLKHQAETNSLFIARVGGDEFGVITTARDRSDVSEAAEQILKELSHPVELSDGFHPMSASIGISIYPDDGEEPTTLLARADSVMYEGKRGGGNVVRYAASASAEQHA